MILLTLFLQSNSKVLPLLTGELEGAMGVKGGLGDFVFTL